MIYHQDQAASGGQLPLCPYGRYGPARMQIYCFVQVNANGVLSFRSSFTSHQPLALPLSSAVIIIAPFWNNIDVERTGQIFHRFSSNQTLLDEVGSLVNDGSGFAPSSLFIATWDRVAAFTGSANMVTHSLQQPRT